MIQMQDVYKVFERKGVTNEALKNINLTVNKGDIFGVIGYSGAGKSTLIRLVNYLERPTKGRVLVDGKPLDLFDTKQLRAMKKNIGMIFQHFNLLESKTVFDNVAIPLVLTKTPKTDIQQRVTELLEFVGLGDKAKSFPNELSGGQKQRVGIARALASNPSILLCDEATSALDPQTTRSILQLLKRINEEYNITIMIITHEMSVIQEICNRVAVMEKGEIIEQGTVLEVFGKPKHPTTKNFVRTVIQDSMQSNMKELIQRQSAQQRHQLDANQQIQIYKLEFVGEHASEPIIHTLYRKYVNVQLNILFANMTEIQSTTLGHMVIQLKGNNEDIQEAVAFLEDKGVTIREVKE
ncbi:MULTISPECIES: methionine ABC transporter ATP-binding protein [Bacillaceae]|uniref:ATP-binding cassette domain-containing protein n=1 Tax=Evansella alkalicola TaxID=745819 RepID=A0ABS6JWG7_9BACI|nr:MULTISPECIES: ATP-binding cassette domain-containing protein [Bacillaceae]MBU9721587.1 ATP-binding cassette domain-containing protein [Bacillus alkalicola]